MATNSSRIAKNTLFLYFRMLLVMGISLVTAGVTMRVLGKVDYGLSAVLGGVVAMFSFLNGALSAAVSRNITFELGRNDFKRTREIFNVSLVVFVILSIVIVVLCETVGLWFFHNKMIIPKERLDVAFWVLQFSIISVPFTLTQIPYNAVLIAHENMKIYAYVSIADAVVRLLTAYFLIVSPFDKLLTLSVLVFGWSICTIVFYRFYCIRNYGETKIMFCRDMGLYKGILTFAGSDLIGNASCLAQGQGLNLLLNIFFGPVVNAARGVAYGLQGMTTQFSANFMTAVNPQIVKSYAAGDYAGMWRLVKRASCFSLYLIWLLALPACLEGDFVLRFWLGDYPEHTLSFFHLIVIVCLIEVLRRPIIQVIHATGHVFGENIIVGTIQCLAFPLAYIFLLMGFEPESVFWCTIFTMFTGGVFEWFVLKYYHTFNILPYVIEVYGRSMMVVVVSSIVPFWIYDRFMEPSIIRMLVTGLITTASVGMTAFYIGMSKGDRTMLLKLASDKINGLIRRKGI